MYQPRDHHPMLLHQLNLLFENRLAQKVLSDPDLARGYRELSEQDLREVEVPLADIRAKASQLSMQVAVPEFLTSPLLALKEFAYLADRQVFVKRRAVR